MGREFIHSDNIADYLKVKATQQIEQPIEKRSDNMHSWHCNKYVRWTHLRDNTNSNQTTRRSPPVGMDGLASPDPILSRGNGSGDYCASLIVSNQRS